MDSGGVRHRVLGVSGRPPIDVIILNCFQELGHLMRTPAHPLLFRDHFARDGQNRRKQCRIRALSRHRSLKKLALVLGSVVVSPLPGWGPIDEDCRWF